MIFRKTYKFLVIVLLIGILPLINSCKSGGYSFTGASISGETISVDFFPNKATLVQPNLSQVFTDNLRDRFINQSSLQLVQDNADLHLEGEIVDYRVTPQAIQGDQTAALNRLSIEVNVRFTNKTKEEDNFESKFKAFEDYNSSQSLSDVEAELMETICDRLSEDIFNKAVVNW